MAILNYTTQIAVEKTVGEIHQMLAKAKAKSILSDYDSDGELVAISFRIMCKHGLMSFKLPANVEKIYTVIQKSTNVPKAKRTKEQASRVAWRIIKDWLEAQLALIQAEMVTVDQVFLPYVQDSAGNTLYELLAKSNFKGLALPESSA